MNAEAVVTIASLLFGGYHLARAAWQRVAVWAPVERWVEDVATASAPEAPNYSAYLVEADDEPEPVGITPLAAHEWLELLNDTPSDVPHVAACGPSGSGKSTFVLALVRHRPGKLVITTIKNAADDPWGGFPAVRLSFRRDERGGIEPDWSPIGAAIEAVYQEVNARHADGERPRTPLTLVVDELTATVAALGKQQMVPRLIHMWLTARSVGVRLIVMDPTINVEGWGLAGRGDVRESIAFVRYNRNKTAMLGSVEELRATDGIWLETGEVPTLAAGPLDASRVWTPSTPLVVNTPPAPTRDTRHEPPTSATITSYEAELVALWHGQGETSQRALARRLYAQRGGQGDYDGSGGPWYAVKAALRDVVE